MSKGYEVEDVKPRIVLPALVALAVLALAIQALAWFVFDYWRTRYFERDAVRTQIATQPSAPPEPGLEVDPSAGWNQYRQEQQRLLNSYGWVSREDGKVRIPIEHAMDLVVAGK